MQLTLIALCCALLTPFSLSPLVFSVLLLVLLACIARHASSESVVIEQHGDAAWADDRYVMAELYPRPTVRCTHIHARGTRCDASHAATLSRHCITLINSI